MIIDKYGTESDKVLSRVYAGVGVAATATATAVAATAVYAAPTVAAAASSVGVWATTTGATVATAVATRAMPIINSAAMNTDKIITKADVGLNVVNAGISIYNQDYNQALTDLVGALEAFYTDRYVSLNSIWNERNIPTIAGVGTEDDINGFGDVNIPTLPKNKTQKDYLSAIQSGNNGNGSTFRSASNVSDTENGEAPKLIKNKFPDEPLPSDGKIIDYTIENGKIKGINGEKNLDFVITKDGKLIIGKKHHLLGNAEDVQAAGQLRLNGKGAIRRIDNQSGHYQPTVSEAINYPELFKNAGIEVEGSTLELYEFTTTSDGWISKVTKVLSKLIK